MSDRIAVMHRGRIEQVGTPEDLYDRPATSFVADFIGTTNLLGGTVESLGPDVATVCLDSGDRCVIGVGGRRPGQPVQVSIRPEAIRIAAVEAGNGAEAAAGSAGALLAQVEQVAYLGAAVQYHIRTEKGLALSVLAGRAGPEIRIRRFCRSDLGPGRRPRAGRAASQVGGRVMTGRRARRGRHSMPHSRSGSGRPAGRAGSSSPASPRSGWRGP